MKKKIIFVILASFMLFICGHPVFSEDDSNNDEETSYTEETQGDDADEDDSGDIEIDDDFIASHQGTYDPSEEGYPEDFYTSGEYEFYIGSEKEEEVLDSEGTELASRYSQAQKAYEQAVRREEPKEVLAALEHKRDEALEKLSEYCASKNYEFETCGKWGVTIIGPDKQPITTIGDPVILATGKFIVRDTDLSFSAGNTTFAMERYFCADYPVKEKKQGGALGYNWTTIFDCRLIDCVDNISLSDEEMESVREYIELLKSSKSEIEDCANEDSDCLEFLEQITELYESESKKFESLLEKKQKASIKNNSDRSTAYGYAGVLSELLSDDFVLYCDEDDGFFVFEEDESGSYHCQDSRFDRMIRLKKESAGRMIEYLNTGEKRFFSQAGKLQKIENHQGKGGNLDFIYDAAGNVSKIRLDAKYDVRLFWKSNKISRIEDSFYFIEYEYSGDFLSAVTDWEGDTKKFEYDADGNLVKQIKADGSYVTLKYEKLGETYRCTSTKDEEGNSEFYEYDVENRITYYTNPDGVKSEYAYDDQNRTIREKYADGYEILYEYDASGRLKSRKSILGQISFVYDDHGKLLEKKYSDGTKEVLTYAGNTLSSCTDRDGITTRYRVESNGRVSEMTVGNQSLYKLSYDKDGLLLSVSDCRGNMVSYIYDAFGRKSGQKFYSSESTDPVKVEKWITDVSGRILGYEDDAGIKLKFIYGDHSLKIISSEKIEVEYEFSPRKLVVAKTITDTMTGEKRVFEYEYDKTKRLRKQYISGVDSKGRKIEKIEVTSRNYTPAGSLSEEIIWNTEELNLYRGFMKRNSENQRGICFSYDYDSFGSINKVNIGTIYESGKNNSKTFFTFEKYFGLDGLRIEKKSSDYLSVKLFNEDLLQLEEKKNNSLIFSAKYSSGGRLLEYALKNSGIYEIDYDDFTGLVHKIKEKNGTDQIGSEYEFYADGKIRKVTDSRGKETFYEYDEFGNLKKWMGREGVHEYEYGPRGFVTAYKVLDSTGKLLKKIEWKYDFEHRKITVIAGGKYRTTYLLDAFYKITSMIDAEGNKTDFEYDLLGRRISTTDPYGNNTFFIWNGFDQIAHVIYPDKSFLNFEYDAAGNCVCVSDSAGRFVEATYDSERNLKSCSVRPFSKVEKYEYDDYGRVTRIYSNDELLMSNEFSDDGNRKCVKAYSGGNKPYVTEYDEYGRILSEKNRLDRESAYSYERSGHLKSKKDFRGIVTDYSYSSDGLLMRNDFSDGSFSEFEYDAAGNLVCAKNQNNRIDFEYDVSGRIVSQKDSESAEKLFFYYDERGLLKTVHDSHRTIRYEYGKNCEMISIVDSFVKNGVASERRIDFLYDIRGREKERIWSTGECEKTYYDEVGRVILKTGISRDKKLFFVDGAVFDEKGFKVLSIDSNYEITRYSYDSMGRICSVAYPSNEKNIKYFQDFVYGCGMYTIGAGTESKMLNLSRNEIEALQKILHKISGSEILINPSQSVLLEEFVYDSKSNMIQRKTPYGTVNYKYDEENHLLEWGDSCSADYDENGNLILENTKQRIAFYDYDSQNRIVFAQIIDLLTGAQKITRYEYDALGRRCRYQSPEGDAEHIHYIGLSFNAYSIEKSSDHKNDVGSPAKLVKTEKNLERIRFLEFSGDMKDEKSRNTKNVYDRGSESAVTYDYKGNPVFIIADDDGVNNVTVLLTDDVGTVKSSVDSGFYSYYSYDVAGNPYDLVGSYGFVGKKYDFETMTYNFGFRDYSPGSMRFTTADPIKDGLNWYVYCCADPVNFTDFDGLMVEGNGSDIYMDTKENASDADYKLANSNEYIKDVGCVLTSYTRIASEILGYEVSLKEANQIALDNGLFSKQDNGTKNLLTNISGADLINEILAEHGRYDVKVTFAGTIESPLKDEAEKAKNAHELEVLSKNQNSVLQAIQNSIFNKSDEIYHATARVMTHSKTVINDNLAILAEKTGSSAFFDMVCNIMNTNLYGHTLNLAPEPFKTLCGNIVDLIFNDTSRGVRPSLLGGNRYNVLTKVDFFREDWGKNINKNR